MTRFISLLLLFCAVQTTTFAQEQAFNTTLMGQLSYGTSLNDIWGYAAPDGTEYALVGARSGFSIVSLADPTNPTQLFFIDGDLSTWRDIKTYGNYAYVTTDTGDDGLLIVDLSDLPNSAPFEFFNLGIDGSNETLLTAHNLYIDETTGLMYISGGNYNSGGMVIYDVDTSPGEALFVNTAPNIYSHDVFVQDGLMYASEIFAGELSIYDVSDPMNISLVGRRETPFTFTHNAWTNAAGDFVFTTDERANAPTAAYDITDPTNPVLVDEFRPARSVGQGVIPHNTHVLNDYMIISHYTDGLEIVDVSDPSNMVEVAYYDTWTGGPGGFNGCWGAYPFLPSGLVLATDISNGLFVVEVDYQRASYLEGVVTDANSGNALNNVSVSIAGQESNSNTNAAGMYESGAVGGGEFEVTFFLPGYESLTQTVTLVEGQTVTLDAELTQLQQVSFTAQVVSALDASPISDATVFITGLNGSATLTSDNNGNVNINSIFTGDYDIFAGKWGFQDITLSAEIAEGGGTVLIQLFPGYQDGFAIDQGWTSGDDGVASTGFWVRGVPNGTSFNGGDSNPGADATGDVGGSAYVTGNFAGGGAGTDDIDDGIVDLISPIIDYSIYPDSNLRINYEFWFFNAGGDGNPNDEVRIIIDNGTNSEIVKTYSVAEGTMMSQWIADSIDYFDLGIEITNEMRFIIEAEDVGEGHLSEAGLDHFRVTSLAIPPSNVENVALPGLDVDVFPNPSADYFGVNYQLPFTVNQATLEVVDLKGRMVSSQVLGNGRNGRLVLGQQLPAGSYFLQLRVDGELAYATKVVKQ